MDDEARRFALTITRKADYSLHFDPAPNSIGFANALSYHFTGNESLEEKKRLAIAHAIAVEEGRAEQKPYLVVTSEHNNPGLSAFEGFQGFQDQQQDLYSPNHLTPPSHGNSPHRVRSLQEKSRTHGSPYGHARRPNSMSGPALGLNQNAGPPGSGVWKPEGSSVIKKGRKGKLTDAQREGAKMNRLKKSVCEKHRKARTKCDPEKCPDNALYGAVTSRRASAASWASPMSENKRSPSSVSSGYFPNVSNPGSIGNIDLPNNSNPFNQPYSIPPPSEPFPRTPENQYVQPMLPGPPLGQHPYDLTGMTPDQPVTRSDQPPDVLSEYTVNGDWINFDVDMSKNDPYPIYSSGTLVPNIGTEIPPQGLASSYYGGNESLESRPVSIRPISLADYDPTYMNDGTQTGSWPTFRSHNKGASKPELRAKKWLDKLKKYISKFRKTFKV